jgi:acyl carrier protein phosphodiesterase
MSIINWDLWQKTQEKKKIDTEYRKNNFGLKLYTEEEYNIIISLLDREIENFLSVHERTKKENWLNRVKELEVIKEKLKSNMGVQKELEK